MNGRSDQPISKTDLDATWNAGGPDELDFEDVKGQEHAKRGIGVAAAGSHNVLMIYAESTDDLMRKKGGANLTGSALNLCLM
ncbi:MAG: ATP-binding protein [Syntrophobacteraceae bacterium]